MQLQNSRLVERFFQLRSALSSNTQAILSVLIRNYTFELRDGLSVKVDEVPAIIPRPKIAGEDGYAMPMRVRRADYRI